MVDVSEFNGVARPPINWGKWTLIVIGAAFSFFAAGDPDGVDLYHRVF